jgi:hypothetical protein
MGEGGGILFAREVLQSRMDRYRSIVSKQIHDV